MAAQCTRAGQFEVGMVRALSGGMAWHGDAGTREHRDCGDDLTRVRPASLSTAGSQYTKPGKTLLRQYSAESAAQE